MITYKWNILMIEKVIIVKTILEITKIHLNNQLLNFIVL